MPSVLAYTEVVPKNVARVGAHRSEQLQVSLFIILLKTFRLAKFYKNESLKPLLILVLAKTEF